MGGDQAFDQSPNRFAIPQFDQRAARAIDHTRRVLGRIQVDHEVTLRAGIAELFQNVDGPIANQFFIFQ